MPRRKDSTRFTQSIQRSAAVLFVAVAGTAQAHSVSVSSGTVVVERSAILVDLSIPIDDLLHDDRPVSASRLVVDDRGRLSADLLAECARRYELQVLRHFVIRDAQGRRINGRITLATHDNKAAGRLTEAEGLDYSTLRAGRANYRLEYELAEPPTYLTFQQTFFSDGRSHVAQLVLDVRVDADQPGCIVQLTNRGNAETVEVHWNDMQKVPLRIEAPARFRTVTGQLRIEPAGIRLSINLPLALLETWSPVARSDPDFVTSEEWSDAKGRLADLFESAASVKVDGRPISAAVSSIELLEPDHESSQHRQAPQRWPSWAARVGATIEFAAEPSLTRDTASSLTHRVSGIRDVVMDWQLFNAAVLEAEVTCVDGNRVTTHRLTPYEPTLRWSAQTQSAGE